MIYERCIRAFITQHELPITDSGSSFIPIQFAINYCKYFLHCSAKCLKKLLIAILMKRLIIACLLLVVALTVQNHSSLAADQPSQLTVPALFSNHMVLQRNKPVPVWGTAEPGSTIKVTFKDQRKQAKANSEGQWKLKLDPEAAGGPFRLTIIAGDTLSFEDVMVGEVWLASGQSNMEMPLAGWGKIKNYRQEIAHADYPNIRLFTVERSMSPKPLDKINNKNGWLRCSPETIPEFSAAAYFFGRSLYKDLDVPIGLIHSSWGGTIVEAWTSRGTLEQFPEFSDELAELRQKAEDPGEREASYEKKMAKWNQEVQAKDDGMNNGKPVWAGTQLDDASWSTMRLPTLWEDAGLDGMDGVVWFRKSFNLPQNWNGDKATVQLGPIDDNEITWINGQKVGATEGYTEVRKYTVPPGLLKAGSNTIVVRVLDTGGGGGLYGQADEMKLVDSSGNTISLSGSWKYKVGVSTKELSDLPNPTNIPNRPTVLYNAMIHPLIPYRIRGAIWYQGESNAGRAYQYRKLFSGMIKDWRNLWDQGDFPFFFVQLANYKARKDQPAESEWAELREAQAMALELPNTGMATAIDIGNAKDIHPKNKQEVGRRLALQARNKVYGEDVVASGPMYKPNSMKVDGNKVRLAFNHVDGGLTTQGSNELKGFAVAGSDQTFHWTDARIEGNQVVVWSDEVDQPVAVRYAWAANPGCNLYNEAGLPAVPFRTDDWPGITKGRK